MSRNPAAYGLRHPVREVQAEPRGAGALFPQAVPEWVQTVRGGEARSETRGPARGQRNCAFVSRGIFGRVFGGHCSLFVCGFATSGDAVYREDAAEIRAFLTRSLHRIRTFSADAVLPAG